MIDDFIRELIDEYSGLDRVARIIGDLHDEMNRLSTEDFLEFIRDEPDLEHFDLLNQCRIAARVHYFYMKKTGRGTAWYEPFWFLKPRYCMPEMVLPFDGKYPELNWQYIHAGDVAHSAHNIYVPEVAFRRA